MKLALIVILSSMLPGCSSLTLIPTNYPVFSDPAGAKIYLNGQYSGETPQIIHLGMERDHDLRLEKEGYCPFSITLQSKIGGNFIQLVPSEVNITLTKKINSENQIIH